MVMWKVIRNGENDDRQNLIKKVKNTCTVCLFMSSIFWLRNMLSPSEDHMLIWLYRDMIENQIDAT